jgi:hypothetical protein
MAVKDVPTATYRLISDILSKFSACHILFAILPVSASCWLVELSIFLRGQNDPCNTIVPLEELYEAIINNAAQLSECALSPSVIQRICLKKLFTPPISTW